MRFRSWASSSPVPLHGERSRRPPGAGAPAIAPILGFLADEIGLTGIGKAVRDIVHGVQEKVDKAIDKVLDYIVQKGKGFYEKGKAAASKVLAWWQQRKDVLIGEDEHSIYMDGTEDAPQLMIASSPGVRWSDYLKPKGKKATANQKRLLEETQQLAADLEKPLSASSTPEEKAKRVEEKRTLFNKVAKNIVALGFSKEGGTPASVIKYGPTRPDGGGTVATASVLSKNHPVGSVPSDEPPIWNKLGNLKQSRNYVQGHLLNHNLGGEGRRFNLTPINKKANSDHLHQVEQDVKETVNPSGKNVMFYQVKAVYGTHPETAELKDLKAKQKAGSLKKDDAELLEAHKAEQKLCTEFKYTAYDMIFDGDKWIRDKNSKEKATGTVEHNLEG